MGHRTLILACAVVIWSCGSDRLPFQSIGVGGEPNALRDFAGVWFDVDGTRAVVIDVNGMDSRVAMRLPQRIRATEGRGAGRRTPCVVQCGRHQERSGISTA